MNSNEENKTNDLSNKILTVTIDGREYSLKVAGRKLEEIKDLAEKLNEEIQLLKKKLSNKNFSYENLLIMVCLKIMEEKKISHQSVEKVDYQLQNILEILSNE